MSVICDSEICIAVVTYDLFYSLDSNDLDGLL